MRASLRSKAPWLAAGATAVLCAAFWITSGQGSLQMTTYESPAQLNGSFASANSGTGPFSAGVSSPAANVLKSTGTPVAGADPAGPGSGPRPRHSHHGNGKASAKLGIHTSSGTLKAAASSLLISTVPSQSPLEGVPQGTRPQMTEPLNSDSYSPDLIRESFESELSKVPLDAKASAGGVILRVVGLCRWQGHFIARVSVTNDTGKDFFVKDLAAYSGAAILTLKAYFRLLVEAGRTREEFVVFDAPSGAKVQLVQEEDEEGGRILKVQVPYPF